MNLKKALLTAAAFVLIGSGCAVAPAPDIEADTGATSPAPTTASEDAMEKETGEAMEKDGEAMEKMEKDGEAMEKMEKDSGVMEKDESAAMEKEEASEAMSATVIIFNGSTYSPKNVTINAGETVTFKNASDKTFWPASNVHPVHNILPEFDANRPLPTGAEYSFTFTKAGSWPWHDHLRASQTGVITVK